MANLVDYTNKIHFLSENSIITFPFYSKAMNQDHQGQQREEGQTMQHQLQQENTGIRHSLYIRTVSLLLVSVIISSWVIWREQHLISVPTRTKQGILEVRSSTLSGRHCNTYTQFGLETSLAPHSLWPGAYFSPKHTSARKILWPRQYFGTVPTSVIIFQKAAESSNIFFSFDILYSIKCIDMQGYFRCLKVAMQVTW